jgi:hypothetical protein
MATISPFGQPMLVWVPRLNRKTNTRANIEKILKNQLLKRVFDLILSEYYKLLSSVNILFLKIGWNRHVRRLYDLSVFVFTDILVSFTKDVFSKFIINKEL